MVLLLTIACLTVWADEEPERLPGSDLGMALAQRRARYIVEAKIVQMGEPLPDRSRDGGLSYPRVFILPSKAIKGARWWTDEAPPQVGLLATKKDLIPAAGEAYILYIEQVGRGLCIFKVTRRDGAVPVRETGSGISLVEAEKAAIYVIEARIRDTGRMERDPDRPPRGFVYPQVAIEPFKMIKGTDKATALATRNVRLPFARDEAPLEKGKVYTLYLRATDRGFEVFRVTKRFEDEPARLPGGGLSMAEAESKALYIIEARVLRLGELQEDRSRPHGLVYPQVVIEQSKVVKERHEGAARPGRDVRLLLTEDEAIPNEGETYTLYVRGRDRGFEVFKVTRPSEVNRR
jgi:hypothetical protein